MDATNYSCHLIFLAKDDRSVWFYCKPMDAITTSNKSQKLLMWEKEEASKYIMASTCLGFSSSLIPMYSDALWRADDRKNDDTADLKSCTACGIHQGCLQSLKWTSGLVWTHFKI